MAIGVESEASLTPQERLQKRLADPKTVESLNRLLDRLDIIVFLAEALEGFIRRAEVVADSVAQGVAELRRMGGDEGGADLIGSLPKLARAGVRIADLMDRPEVGRLIDSGLIEKLGDPKTLEALSALLGNLELASGLFESLGGFAAKRSGRGPD